MKVKKSLESRIRGWLPKTPNLPKQPSAPSFKRTETFDKKGLMNQNFLSNSSTNLLNGIMIGGSAAVLLIGLLLWSSLNSIYWSQRYGMLMSGVTEQNVEYILLGTAFDISFCASAVVISGFLLIVTSIMQLSTTFRSLMKKRTLNWANVFLAGGAIAIMFSVSNMVLYSYPSASTSAPFFSIVFGTAGAILVSLGVLWIGYLYFKFRNSLTVVQGAPA